MKANRDRNIQNTYFHYPFCAFFAIVVKKPNFIISSNEKDRTLGEIICSIIPNQSLDRMAKYLLAIREKVEELSKDIENNKEKINLIEIGLRFSANATFDEKCNWIANIVIQGLDNAIEISMADNIINIVSELNYEQVIILYYHVPWIEKSNFVERFKNLFDFNKLLFTDRAAFCFFKSKETFNVTTLAKLGLIIKTISIIDLPYFGISSHYDNKDLVMLQKQLYELTESISKNFNSNSYEITDLGELVVKTMSLNEEELYYRSGN